MVYETFLDYWMMSEGEDDIVETLDSLFESRRNQKTYKQDLRTGVMKRYRAEGYIYRTWDQLVNTDGKPCYASLEEWQEDEKNDLQMEIENTTCKLEYISDLFRKYKNTGGKKGVVNEYEEVRMVYKWYKTMREIRTGSVIVCRKESGDDADIFLVAKDWKSYSLICLACGDVVKSASTISDLLGSYKGRILSRVSDDEKIAAVNTLAGKYLDKIKPHGSGYAKN